MLSFNHSNGCCFDWKHRSIWVIRNRIQCNFLQKLESNGFIFKRPGIIIRNENSIITIKFASWTKHLDTRYNPRMLWYRWKQSNELHRGREEKNWQKLTLNKWKTEAYLILSESALKSRRSLISLLGLKRAMLLIQNMFFFSLN